MDVFIYFIVFWILQQVQNFGEPFFLVIREGETLAEVKERIQKKLQVPDEEFSKVFFSSLSLLSYCLTQGQTYFVSILFHSMLLKFASHGCLTEHHILILLLNVISLCSPYEHSCSAQWKFAFLSLGRPDYLQDSDIVSSRFQVSLSLSLSLTHTHTRTHRAGMHMFSVPLNMPTVVSFACGFNCLSSFLLISFQFSEKGCLWCLGAVSWVGTHRQCS